MTDTDLSTIRHFSRSEIEASGGSVEGLSFALFQKLDRLRDCFGRPLSLLSGGLNSGRHISNTDVHAQGIAADLVPIEPQGAADVTGMFRAFLDAGLHGFGAYWGSQGVRSYHVDDRPSYALWLAVWDAAKGDWGYLPWTMTDPATLAGVKV